MLGPFLLLESTDEDLDNQRSQHNQSRYNETSDEAECMLDKRHKQMFLSVALGFAAQ